MTTTITLIAVYVISVFLNYRWVKRAYSKATDTTKEGIYSNLDVDSVEVVCTITPGLNTLTAIILLTESPYKEKLEAKPMNKFFGVKK